MLKRNEPYTELGGDDFLKRQESSAYRPRLVQQIERMGSMSISFPRLLEFRSLDFLLTSLSRGVAGLAVAWAEDDGSGCLSPLVLATQNRDLALARELPTPQA